MKEYYKAILDNEYKGKFWMSNLYKKVNSNDPEIIDKINKGKIIKCEPEKVIIEKILHPCLKWGDIEFLHEHRGQRIVFSVWKNGKEISKQRLSFHRETILYDTNFYKTFNGHFSKLFETIDGYNDGEVQP